MRTFVHVLHAITSAPTQSGVGCEKGVRGLLLPLGYPADSPNRTGSIAHIRDSRGAVPANAHPAVADLAGVEVLKVVDQTASAAAVEFLLCCAQ